MHTIRGKHDLEQISMRHLDGRDLRSGEHDKVGEDASDAGGVADAEEALLFAFAVDYNGFEAD